jgi:putative flippase GtrA
MLSSMVARIASLRRFSRIRSVNQGTKGQGIRFLMTGAVVAVVYLTATTVLADVCHVTFQLALIAGYAMAICVHFVLQRLFVWAPRRRFALGVREQVGRYLLLALFQYAVTATTTSLLPHALGTPVTLVYLATAAALTTLSFLVFRSRVFHSAD